MLYYLIASSLISPANEAARLALLSTGVSLDLIMASVLLLPLPLYWVAGRLVARRLGGGRWRAAPVRQQLDAPLSGVAGGRPGDSVALLVILAGAAGLAGSFGTAWLGGLSVAGLDRMGALYRLYAEPHWAVALALIRFVHLGGFVLGWRARARATTGWGPPATP